MRFNITNRVSGVRSFTAGGRYLTLAGGEVERGVELSNAERDALLATREFHVREVKEPDAPKAAATPIATPHKTGRTTDQ